MSNRYKGGVISATPPTTTGGNDGVASGAWTLEQQMQLQAAGLWPSQPPPPNVENVFSTYSYTGNDSTQTITNGINLSGRGGLVWIKNLVYFYHNLFDTVRGPATRLYSNETSATDAVPAGEFSFSSSGFGLNTTDANINRTGDNYASWTFREQPKFFDIVTYTGTGVARTVAHNLGSAPGCVIVKRTDSANDWIVWHRSGTQNNNQAAILNATDSYSTIGTGLWGAGGGTPDMNSATISIGGNNNVNAVGGTFLVYIFAHDAGGFGATGTENVISCGSFTTDGSGAYSVTLGYEPQWVLIKRTDSTGDWLLMDNIRGMPVGGNDAILRPNTLGDQTQTFDCANPTATGFYESTGSLGASRTFIYIAIRRGPMGLPTSGTQVYATDTRNGTAPNPPTFNSGFPVDWALSRDVSQTWDWVVSQRLLGNFGFDGISTVAATDLGGDWGAFNFMNGFNTLGTVNANYRSWMFRRYPNVFDVVCYTGTGSAQALTHNLGAVPEMMIVKGRSGTQIWGVYTATTGNTGYLTLNATDAFASTGITWNNTSPTSSQFTVGTYFSASTQTFVAYLFATCAGVSKVGSYTGSSSSDVVVDCGFTAGARFVLIKRTDTTGGWYVYDSARGINPSNEPYILTNSTAAEVAGTNYIGPYSTGFYVNTGSPLNATTGANYIFLAIA